MPVVIIRVIGGILVALTLATSGIANINTYNKHVQQKNNQVNEEIQEEIDELMEDYNYCEEVHIKNMIHEGEIENELTEEDLEEIRYEFISTYSNEVENRVNISNRTFDYMRKQLDKKTQESLEFRSKLKHESMERMITYEWLKKFVLNQKGE